LAAVTGAMAQVTITGMVQANTSRSVTTTSGATSTVNSIDDSNGNTGVNFGVSEDLDGGMKFVGNIGLNLGIGGSNTPTATNGVYETYAGLSGGFGSIKAGTLQTPQFLVIANGDAGGYLISNPVANLNQHQGGTVGSTTLLQSNSFQYVLPTFVEGLSLKYQTSLGEVATNINGSNHIAADFKTGGLSTGIAYTTYKYTQALEDTAQSIYASYNFGAATLKAMYASANTGGASGVNGTSVGIVVPVGAVSLMANYGTSNGIVLNNATVPTARTVSTQKQEGTFVGATYSLSKRTTATAAYYKETGNNGLVAASNNSFSHTRFYLVHAF
jgi:hypothetical protein